MREGDTMSAQPFYARLRNAYTGSDSNDAKMWQFRLVMEDYMNFLVASDSPDKLQFNEAQEIWVARTKNYRLNSMISFVRRRLNNVVHGKRSGTSDADLKIYFDSCVLIINLISGETPDRATLAAFGKVDEVLDNARVVFVNAGPGTGKTHLLVYKILDTLVREKECDEVLPGI